MEIPEFDDIFQQIKTNFWFIGIPFNQRGIKLRYFVLLFSLIITILEEAAFFVSNISAENFIQLTQLAPCTCIGLLSVLKILSITSKRQNIFNLTRCLKQLYVKMTINPEKWHVVRRDLIFLKTLVKYFFILNIILISIYCFSTLIFIFYHYCTENELVYRLPFAVLCPFATDVWYTWLFVYFHLICSGFICVLYFTTVDALYCTLTSHICAQFSLLSKELQYLDKSTHNLEEIVEKHQYILKLSEDLEEIFQAPNLFNILIGSILICALGFNLTMGEWSRIPGVFLFLLSILMQILMISIFGENLIRESRKVGDAAFLCKWYEMENKAKQIIILLILRSNKPQKLTAYKFSVISHQSFTKIISTSWSYFTILRTIYNATEKNK